MSDSAPFGGEEFSVSEMAAALKWAQEDYYDADLAPWVLCRDSDGDYLRALDELDGSVATARAVSPRQWRICLWVAPPREEVSELTLEVLASLYPALRIEYTELDMDDPECDYLNAEQGPVEEQTTNAEITARKSLLGLDRTVKEITRVTFCEALEKIVPEMKIKWVGGMGLSESVGEMFGYEYYFRYRNGKASLFLGGSPRSQPLWTAEQTYDNHGLPLSWPGFARKIHSLILGLGRAPQLFHFPIIEKETGEPIPYPLTHSDEERFFIASAWGKTEEEAYSRTKMAETLPPERRPNSTISPISLNAANMGFPSTDPEFVKTPPLFSAWSPEG